MEKQLGPAPCQCALSRLLCSAAIIGEKPNSSHLSATVFSRSFAMQLLTLPETQDGLNSHHFVSVQEIQQNMTAGLTAIKEDFRGASSNSRTTGASVYVQKGST
jgi:hypothetical protein